MCRNHRLLADQFRQLPDPEEYPKYYQLRLALVGLGERELTASNSSSPIPERSTPSSPSAYSYYEPSEARLRPHSLQNGYYTFPSQVFADLKLCFVNVGLAHNRSALRAQDAAKMEAVLEDLWDAEPDLPNVAQIGTSFDDGTGNIGLEDAGSPLEEVDDPMMTGGSHAPPASTVPRKKPRLTLPGGDVATEQSLAHLASFTDHLHTMLPSTDVNAAYAQLMGETPYSSLPGTPTAAEGSGSQQIVKLKRPVGRPRKSVPPDTPAKASTSKAPLAPQPTAAPPIVPVIYASAVPHVDSPAAEGSEAGDGQTETLSRKQKEEKEREEVAVPDTETGWLQDPVDKVRLHCLDCALRAMTSAHAGSQRSLPRHHPSTARRVRSYVRAPPFSLGRMAHMEQDWPLLSECDRHCAVPRSPPRILRQGPAALPLARHRTGASNFRPY